MKKNLPVLGIAVALFIFIRCIFNNDVNLKYIVATLNIVAVVFVVYTILERVIANVVAKIERSQAPIQIRMREKSRFR